LTFALYGQAIASGGDDVLGSWFGEGAGKIYVVSFLADGRYVFASAVPGDPSHTGIEWGAFAWNPSTGAITATSTGDTNGNWGLAGDSNGTQYLTVSGNTGLVFQPGCTSCTLALTRILPSNSPIVGSWLGNGGANTYVLSFLSDGRYVESAAVTGDPAHTGIEWGTYSWNPTTGGITASSVGDTNGNWGLAGDSNGTQYLTVSGNTGLLSQPSCVDCSLPVSRILPVAPGTGGSGAGTIQRVPLPLWSVITMGLVVIATALVVGARRRL
jgi:hypothetical protein